MLSPIFTLALLSTIALAAEEKRQATNGAQFTSAANQLISHYIPSTALPALESAISEGAKSASVSGDANSILYSALLASELPDWFVSAVPVGFSTQIDALGSNIDALRGTVGATLVPVVIAVTTTDSDGNTVTSSVTTNAPTASSTDVVSHLTTKVVDGVTSVFSTAVNGASSVASDISSGGSSVVSDISSGGSSVVSQISSGGSSVVSDISSGGSSVVSEATGGASSVLSEATSGASSILSDASTAVAGATSTSSTGAAAVPTAVVGAAAGVLGLVGMMIAL